MPFAPSSFLLLVAMPGATSGVLVSSSDALCSFCQELLVASLFLVAMPFAPRTLLLAPGITTRSKKLLGPRAPLLGTRTLLVAPGITTRSKKLLGAKGIATRNKDATTSSWHYY